MSISLDEVRHAAKLARLDLDDLEMLALQSELNDLVGHFADIQAIDLSVADPLTHAIQLSNVWADDLAQPSLPREAVLRNSAVSRAGLFVVPTIIED